MHTPTKKSFYSLSLVLLLIALHSSTELFSMKRALTTPDSQFLKEVCSLSTILPEINHKIALLLIALKYASPSATTIEEACGTACENFFLKLFYAHVSYNLKAEPTPWTIPFNTIELSFDKKHYVASGWSNVYLYSAQTQQSLKLWNRKCFTLFKHKNLILLHPQKDSGFKYLYNIENSTTYKLPQRMKRSNNTQISPNEQYIAMTSNDHITLYNIENLDSISSDRYHHHNVQKTAFSTDSKLLVSVSEGVDASIKLWSLENNQLKQLAELYYALSQPNIHFIGNNTHLILTNKSPDIYSCINLKINVTRDNTFLTEHSKVPGYATYYYYKNYYYTNNNSKISDSLYICATPPTEEMVNIYSYDGTLLYTHKTPELHSAYLSNNEKSCILNQHNSGFTLLSLWYNQKNELIVSAHEHKSIHDVQHNKDGLLAMATHHNQHYLYGVDGTIIKKFQWSAIDSSAFFYIDSPAFFHPEGNSIIYRNKQYNLYDSSTKNLVEKNIKNSIDRLTIDQYYRLECVLSQP